MIRIRIRILFVVALTVCATCASFAADDGPPPLEAFFGNPQIRSASLSPSGKWLAIATSSAAAGRVVLAVLNVEGRTGTPIGVAAFNNADVRSFQWVNDEELVYNVVDNEAAGNDQGFGPGLFSVRRDGSAQRMLIRPIANNVTIGTNIASRALSPSNVLAATIDDGSDNVIVAEYRRAQGLYDIRYVTPKRLNVADGTAVALSRGAPDNVQGWLFDQKGHPVVAVAADRGQREIFWHDLAADTWTSIATFPATRVTIVPRAVDAEGNLYVSDADGVGRAVVRKFDFANHRAFPEALISAPGFDLRPVFVFDHDHDSGRLAGIRYETDAAGVTWFDPAMKEFQRIVDERFPGHVNVLDCRHCSSDGALLVRSYSDRDPGGYFLYRPATKEWETIGRARPDVDPRAMANLDFYRTKARDGEDLPVWVTTPRGKADEPSAAVVLVHGGPWLRGTSWTWNPEAQFLASRGYVVIEPEFRGSEGYGSEHYFKGFRQWGGSMQADLVDAVHWAAGKGMIDPARVCIAGASYGGYATLMGLVRDPDTFKCGIAWAAVTDPRLLFEYSVLSDSDTEGREFVYPDLIGDPVKDAAMLKDAAPVEHAKEIRAPLLLAFGGNDRRVPLEHGERIVSAMRANGLKPEYVVYDGEGHGFFKVANRIDFWSRVDRFLAQQLH